MKYKVSAFYKCSTSDDGITLEYFVKAPSKETAILRAMATHRRDWLGGDHYQILKEQKAHKKKLFSFVWKGVVGSCFIDFENAEEYNGGF